MDFLKQVLLQVLARESRRLSTLRRSTLRRRTRSTLRRRTRSNQRQRVKQMRQKERSKLPQ